MPFIVASNSSPKANVPCGSELPVAATLPGKFVLAGWRRKALKRTTAALINRKIATAERTKDEGRSKEAAQTSRQATNKKRFLLDTVS
jgi:hypothetical protein